MIKDILLQVSRSYNPYVQQRELWGAGSTYRGELDNDFNGRKFIRFDNSTDWNIVTVGSETAVGIKTNGTLWGWGTNSNGQLGLGDTVNRSSPVQIGTLNTWVSASTAGQNAFALQNDGTLWGWGVNNVGQLGIGDFVSRSSPIQVGTRTWQKIFGSGNNHTIALSSDNTIFGWGDTTNNNGVYGNGERPGAFGIIDGPNGPWNHVAINRSYTIAIKSDGTMWVWGRNQEGQLGLGDTITRSTISQLGAQTNWVSASANIRSVLAIQSDGTLWGWGDNTNNRLGTLPKNSTIPNYVDSLNYSNLPFSQVETGDKSVFLIAANGTLWSWGSNTSGHLGLGDIVYRSRPVQVGTRTWSSVSSGVYNHTLAIRTDGTLWAWGTGEAGALGLGDVNISRSSPVQVGTETNWSKVSVGYTSHAIKTDGTLWSWGWNGNASLGLNDTISRSSPVQVGTLNNWYTISSGYVAVHAIKTDGTLWVWGDNINGQFGTNDPTRSSPVQIGTRNDWSFIAERGGGTSTMTESSYHGLAIRTDGTLWTWGLNTSGQLGVGNTSNTSSPVQVGTETNWTFGAVGSSFTMAIKSNGTLWSWGNNTDNQLGLGDSVSRSSPVQVGTLTNWSSVSLGYNHAVLVQNNGYVLTTGRDPRGYDVNPVNINRSNPILIGTFDDDWMDVSVGSANSLGIKTDGTLWSWGGGANGELGNNIFSLQKVTNTNDWASGSYANTNAYVHLLKNDSTMWAWGDNSFSLLGDNTNISRSSPVQIGTRIWKKIENGQSHTIALGSDSTIWSWGRNINGELGSNVSSATARSSPVQIGTLTWNDISSTSTYTLAIRNDNTLWGWGINTSGQLGLSDVINRSSPVQIGTRLWSYVSAGNIHSAAIRSDGTLWTWGNNTGGVLGLGNTTSISSPVQVGTLTDWSSVYIAGTGAIIAKKTNGTLWGWGRNPAHGIGDGIDRSSPVQIGTRTDWSDVYTNTQTGFNIPVVAKRNDGTLWVWGATSFADGTRRSSVGIFSSPVQIGTRTDWSSAFLGGGGAGNEFMGAITTTGEIYTGPGISINAALWVSSSQSSPVQIGTETNWAKVDMMGDNISTALKTDGTLWGWGFNTNGFVQGIPASAGIGSPVQVTSDVWNQFSVGKVGDARFGGIKSDGTLWMWGANSSGQLGDGSGTLRSSPVQIGTRLWTHIDNGESYTMAIRNDGTLWGWGINASSQLGLANTTTYTSPVQIGNDTDWYNVYASLYHTAGIRTAWNNDLYTAGAGTTFNIGHTVINGWGGNRRNPFILSQTNPWKSLRVGPNSTFGIKSDNTLWAWGPNTNGQLGLGDTVSRSSPVQVGTRTWIKVYDGNVHTMAIRSDGTLWTWGANSGGQLGINNTAPVQSPVQVGTLLWNDIATNGSSFGIHTSFAIRSDGTLWSWGQNNNGELGSNDTVTRSSPVQVGTETNWARFHAPKTDNASFFAFKTDNSLYALNAGTFGFRPQSGISLEIKSPVQVTSNVKWNTIAAGSGFNIGISSSGSIWHWGKADFGLTGNTIFVDTSAQESPVQIGTLTTWVSASAGQQHAVALRSDGTLWSWGSNRSGQLGLGDALNVFSTPIDRSSPVQVGTLNNWLKLSAGRSHTMAIKTDGTLWGWGFNTQSQLGDGTSTLRSSPVQIGTETNWSNVDAAVNHTVALKTNGTIWSWGLNSSGQLGTGDTTQRFAPVQIGLLNTWVDISASETMSVAVRNDGTLWSWGNNNSGQLGLFRNRSVPNYVVRSSLFNSVKAGYQSVIARSTDNTLWAWGSNVTYGQLGLNDTVNRSSPVQIGTETWSDFSNGGFHAMAVRSGRLWTWGDNSFGGLGLLQVDPQYISGSNVWTNAEAGGAEVILKSTDGTLWGVGSNSSGNLGLNDTVSRTSPVRIGTRTWNSYSTGQAYRLAIRDDNTLWGWGTNTNAELGLAKSRSNPQYVDNTKTWSSIQNGQNSVIAISTNGTLWGWGDNSSGQLGDGTRISKSSAVQIGTETNWAKILFRNNTTLAIKTNGTLWAWGVGSNGELPDGTRISRSSPVQIGTETNWADVFFGSFHAGGIKTDGTLWTWGGNSQGQMGFGDTISRSSAVQVGTRTWLFAAAGPGSTMAIRSDGTLWAWGDNTNGVLGLGDTNINRSSPVQVGTLNDWTRVALWSHTMAVRSNGTLWSWGLNNTGQLGLNLGSTAHRSSPVQVGTLTNWSIPDTSNSSVSIAIKTDGTLWAWGSNSAGGLGDGTVVSRSSPVQIGTQTNIVSGSVGWNEYSLLENTGYAISVGGSRTLPGYDIDFMLNRSSPVQIGTRTWSYASAVGHSLAIRDDGTLWAWGTQGQGQLGLGDVITRSSPVQVGTLNTWSKVYASSPHSYAIRTDGTLWAWGRNILGELGLGNFGDSTNRSSPVQVGTLNTWSSVADTSAGESYHTLAIRTDGTLWAWGRNSEGQLGLNLGSTAHRSSPVQVGTRNDWVSVSINFASSMAVRSDGTVWAWGQNTPNSQLGLGDLINRSSPVQVGTLTTWASASLGAAFSVLLQNNGDAYTTGMNSTDFAYSSTNRSSPVQLGTLSNWAQVDGGYLYSLAIKTDGTLWAWGFNNSGALGDGTSTPRSSPVQIGTLNNWSSVAAGYISSHALKTDGTIWGWGSNADGMLGNNQTTSLSSPIQIGTRTWRSIADKGGFQQTHNMAIRSDGTLWTWGNNTDGQLGQFTSGPGTFRSSPVQVGTRADWVSAAVGDNTSMAIRSDGTLWAWGLNSSAELGLGDVISRSSPVQVGTLSNWASASLGDANSALLLNNGYALTTGFYAHGFDTTSQTVNRSSPVQIGADTDWVSVRTGHSQDTVFAQKSDGTLWGWGFNTAGILADGTLINKSSPVQIGNETTWVDYVLQSHFIGTKQY